MLTDTAEAAGIVEEEERRSCCTAEEAAALGAAGGSLGPGNKTWPSSFKPQASFVLMSSRDERWVRQCRM